MEAVMISRQDIHSRAGWAQLLVEREGSRHLERCPGWADGHFDWQPCASGPSPTDSGDRGS